MRHRPVDGSVKQPNLRRFLRTPSVFSAFFSRLWWPDTKGVAKGTLLSLSSFEKRASALKRPVNKTHHSWGTPFLDIHGTTVFFILNFDSRRRESQHNLKAACKDGIAMVQFVGCLEPLRAQPFPARRIQRCS